MREHWLNCSTHGCVNTSAARPCARRARTSVVEKLGTSRPHHDLTGDLRNPSPTSAWMFVKRIISMNGTHWNQVEPSRNQPQAKPQKTPGCLQNVLILKNCMHKCEMWNTLGTNLNQARNQVKFRQAPHGTPTCGNHPYSYYNTK